MDREDRFEIGLVLYPEAQQAGPRLDRSTCLCRGHRGFASRAGSKPVRVSHWQQEAIGAVPIRVLDTDPQTSGDLTALIVPPTLSKPIGAGAAVVWADWLRDHHAQGAILGSVCGGAFLLGETGLLAARTVTTHWAYAELFRTRFPQSHLDTDRLIIDDGDIITVGGFMAGRTWDCDWWIAFWVPPS